MHIWYHEGFIVITRSYGVFQKATLYGFCKIMVAHHDYAKLNTKLNLLYYPYGCFSREYSFPNAYF